MKILEQKGDLFRVEISGIEYMGTRLQIWEVLDSLLEVKSNSMLDPEAPFPCEEDFDKYWGY